MQDFEKLGLFYLGAPYDLAAKTRAQTPLLYDAKDLVTHAVIVGMTGSGKTGLGITLIEEAAIDGIPSLVIDPKGDLANLLLTFPSLSAQDFRPWINEEDAARKGQTPDQFAQAQADLWRQGLGAWGQDPARIQRFRDAAECVVYTPGSNAGRPVSVLRSLSAPPAAVRDDAESFRDRISTTAAGLLGLLGIDADPIRSREHILLSMLVGQAWSAGRDLDLGTLIAQIQQPPVARIGVMDLESFYPSQERFSLAMALNNLLAAPGFSAWMEGEPLDVGAMLYTPTGKPRVAIVSIAHLSDGERMFVVSLLLSQMLAWTRAQSGTTSLRALLYMDEIAGYFPPVANPPSKQPLLTMMKQARAFGVGVVLATQNPVDIDYKGLSNAGTWFIGRLQTERDKARVLDGLEGAVSGANARFDRSGVEQALSQLGNRVFYMNNVHDDGPEIFETRWCLSYLRGPLTRAQLRTLCQPPAPPTPPALTSPSGPAPVPVPAPRAAPPSPRPVLPPEVPQFFVPLRGSQPAGASLTYRPMLLGTAKVFYADAKLDLDCEVPQSFLTPLSEGPVAVDWDLAAEAELADADLEREPRPGASFLPVTPDAAKPKNYDAWKKSFADLLYRSGRLSLLRSPSLKEVSQPHEHEKDFRLRLAQAAREARDALAERLRQKYAPKLTTLQDRARRAQQAVEVQQAQAKEAKWSTALSFGSALLGAFMGRKVASSGNVGRAASAMRGVGRAAREGGDVDRAEETLAAVQQQVKDLEAQFQAELDSITSKVDPATEPLDEVTVRAKKTGITVRAVVLAWTPHWMQPDGTLAPAWE